MLNYEWIGDRSQPPLIFLHGFLGSGTDFRDIAEHLRSQFACLLIDLPGHGDSLLQDGSLYTMPRTAELLIDLLDQLKLSCSDLYGYSMGGRLALYLALHYPKYFRRVFLESASPGLRTLQERQQRQQSDQQLAVSLDAMDSLAFSHFLDGWYQQPLFQSLLQHADFPKMLQRRQQNQPTFLAKSLRQMGTGAQPSLWSDLASAPLAEMDIQLHLLTGELDRKFVALQDQMRQTHSAVSCHLIAHAGHNVHLENSTAIIRKITNLDQESHFYNAGDLTPQ